MRRIAAWHTTLGELALRLFLLHILWIGGALAGGVVLGIFPATAAAMGVLRRDAMDHRAEEAGAAAEPRSSLLREYVTLWRREFRSANILGWLLTTAWAVLLYEYWLLGANRIGIPGSAVAAGILVLLVLVFVITANVWPLQAHFDEGPLALLRRSLILTLGRPVHSLLLAAGVGAVAGAYYMLPGLAAVFGISLAAFLSTQLLWGAGILAPATAHTEEAAHV